MTACGAGNGGAGRFCFCAGSEAITRPECPPRVFGGAEGMSKELTAALSSEVAHGTQ